MKICCDGGRQATLPAQVKVISVLQPFDDATRVLSTDKSPSMHLVIPTLYQLKMHLTTNGTDSAVVDQFKTHLMAQLLRYYTVTDIHAAATLLDPRLKNNATLMTAELRLRAVATLRKLKQQQTMQRQLRAQAKASNNQTNRSSDETCSIGTLRAQG